MWDWLSMAEALGCEVRIPEAGSIPTWSAIIKEPEDLGRLTVPEPMGDYRFKAALEAIDILTRHYGEDKFLILTMVCPFTLAGELRGVEELIGQVLHRCVERLHQGSSDRRS